MIKIENVQSMTEILEEKKRKFNRAERIILIMIFCTLGLIFVLIVGEAVINHLYCSDNRIVDITQIIQIAVLIVTAISGTTFTMTAKNQRSAIWKKTRGYVTTLLTYYYRLSG